MFLVFLGAPEPTRRPLDIAFLVDSSDNVDIGNWRKLTSFAKRVADSFNVSWPGNHVGFISYGENANVEFNFNVLQGDRLTPDAVRRYIDNVQYQPRGGTRIDIALNVASRDLFSQRGGYRPNARQVKQSVY